MLRRNIVDINVIRLAKEAMKSNVSKQDFRAFLDRKRKENKKEE